MTNRLARYKPPWGPHSAIQVGKMNGDFVMSHVVYALFAHGGIGHLPRYSLSIVRISVDFGKIWVQVSYVVFLFFVSPYW